MKTLIADETHPSIIPLLENIGLQPDYRPAISRAELLVAMPEYEGLVIRSKTRVDAEFLAHSPSLKFIARAGAGLDLIDLEAIAHRNIALFAANEGNQVAVAEHCVAMLLALFNNIPRADAQVRSGIWQREANRGVELSGKTIGIIGYGFMGKAFAKCLAGFGVKVLAYDKYLNNYSDTFAKEAPLDSIFQEADVLSLHIPLTSETKKMCNNAFLGNFRKNIWLINSSRGEIVETQDLPLLLENGKLQGACLDVLENEKLGNLSPAQAHVYEVLFRQPSMIFTPHIAGWTHESYDRINEVLAHKIHTWLHP